MPEKKKEELICQSAIMEEFGWTKGMIDRLLPKPSLFRNPQYAKAPPMKMWPRNAVLDAMNTDEFREAKEKAERRRESARKAARRKQDKLIEEIKTIANQLNVERMPLQKLRRYVIKAKEEFYCERGCYDELPVTPDEATYERWAVNYIRHNLTQYDGALGSLYGKVGKNSAYLVCKAAMLDKIAEVYPVFAEECRRQKENLMQNQ